MYMRHICIHSCGNSIIRLDEIVGFDQRVLFEYERVVVYVVLIVVYVIVVECV